jgi:organic radical activating enzyme
MSKERADWANPFNSMRILLWRKHLEACAKGHFLTPMMADIDPSGHCNYNCYFCNASNIIDNKRKDLPEEHWLKLADFLAKWGSDTEEGPIKSFCVAGGGEPFMNPATPALLERIYENGAETGVITNGSLLNHSKIELLSRVTRWTGFSMDAATKETYNKLKALNYNNLRIKYTPKEQTKGVVWARNKIKEELFTNEEYFLQIDSHSRVKQKWDSILITQYNSIEEPKVIMTTYPNHFDVPGYDKKYLELEHNTPLRIRKFVSPEDPVDNRCQAENLVPLRDYEVKHTHWAAAGFLFTQKAWVDEVKMPDDIKFNGEEDFLTFNSYLKGWNLRVPSEATVWHNYEYRNGDTQEPYREHNNKYLIAENVVNHVNNMLYSSGNERNLNQLEEYFNWKFKPITVV